VSCIPTEVCKINCLTLAIRLTPRELQIAELVAQGLTNTSIGAKLWITEHTVKQALKRIRQIQVSSRTQMVALLFNKHLKA
jgi:DNA-binding CsgD family transcriptional regulator